MAVIIQINEIDDKASLVLEDLARGLCIGLPTETVYGLAADATNGKAVATIFDMKGRPRFNPLICHVANLSMAKLYGQFSTLAETLAKAFWPGPLTLVVPLLESAEIHPLVSAGLGTVGLRAPTGIAGDLISEYGKPLAAPSANRSGKVSPTTADHVAEQFPASNLHVIDAGSCKVGLESTIVKVVDQQLYLLRPGAITSQMMRDATGVLPEPPQTERIEAPGMMKSHYAPNARVKLNCTQCPADAGLLKFSGQFPDNKGSVNLNLSESGNLVEAAANLYSYIQEMDASDTGLICVEPIPMQGLGLAINDRLQRAAAPRNAE